tara:strand:- start:2461 stop:2847 length:387 start_codon:yes stop_codon:yes gene_type:complete
MNKLILQNKLILLTFSVLFTLISCESTNQTSSKVKEITQKTTKIIDLGPNFQLVTTYQNKQIDLFIKDFGNFDLTRKDDDLNFQRLDKGSCRVFVQSSDTSGNINSILVFHLKKKTFYPQFNLKKCIG